MSNFTSILSQDPSSSNSYIYYNIDLVNNEVIDDNKDQPLVNYQDFRTSPLISNANDYFFSIIRFQLNGCGRAIPLYIPIIEKGNDVNKTIYQVGVRYDCRDGSGNFETHTIVKNIMFEPMNKNATLPTEPNNYSNDYYFCHSYEHFANLFNKTTASIAQDLYAYFNISSMPELKAPTLRFNADTNNFELYLDDRGYGKFGKEPINNSECQARLFFNSNLFNLFSNYNHSYLGGDVKNKIVYYPNNDFTNPQYDSTAGCGYEILPPEDPLNLGLSIVSAGDAHYHCLKQEFSNTSSFWSPVSSLVFTTNIVPVIPEVSGPPVEFKDSKTFTSVDTENNFRKIITDMVVPLGDASLYKGTITYYPSSEYRLSEFTSADFDLRNIGISGFFKIRTNGQLIPLRLPNQASISFKLMFKHKSA